MTGTPRFYVRSMDGGFQTLERRFFSTLPEAAAWATEDSHRRGADICDCMLIGKAVRLANTVDVHYRIIDEQEPNTMQAAWDAWQESL